MTLDEGPLKLENGAIITLATKGVLVISSDQTYCFYLKGITTSDSTTHLYNQGTILVVAGIQNDYKTKLSVPMRSERHVWVQLGTLTITSDVDWFGLLTIDEQAAVVISSAEHNFIQNTIEGVSLVQLVVTHHMSHHVIHTTHHASLHTLYIPYTF